jgi:hypothetical protein
VLDFASPQKTNAVKRALPAACAPNARALVMNSIQ